MSIAEICIMKKPAVFVPFPFASEDHQTVNAQKLVNKNAALMIKDDEALAKLVKAVIELSADRHRQEELENNISKLGIANADEIIAVEILRAIM